MKKYYFSCFQGIFKEHKLYATALDCNAVWAVDFERKRAEVIKWLDKSDILSAREYLTVCRIGDRLALIPAKSDRVGFYDFRSDTLTYARLVEPKIKSHEIYDQERKFYGGFSVHEDVYLLGATYPAILKIDAGSGKMSYLDAWVEESQDFIPENDMSFYFAHSYLIDGENVYLPGCASGTMMGLNLLKDQMTVYKKHHDIKMLHGIVRGIENIWVLASLGNRESLLSWSPENGFMDEIIIEKNQSELIYWWGPLESDGSLYLFQMNRNAVYRVDLQERAAKPCEELMNAIGDIPIPDTKNRYSLILIGKEEEKIFFHTRWNQKWFIYNTRDQSIESFRIEIFDEEYENRYWNGLKKKPYFMEQELPLKDFLKIVEEDGVSWTD